MDGSGEEDGKEGARMRDTNRKKKKKDEKKIIDSTDKSINPSSEELSSKDI